MSKIISHGTLEVNQTLSFADGNTTTINIVRVLVSTSASPSWTLEIYNDVGALLYTSSSQSTELSSLTWVTFTPNAQSFSGYVSSLQGNIKIGISVSSGSVTWENASSTQADYVVTGQSDYNIVQLSDNSGSTWSKSIVPNSLRMANGNFWPADNASVTLSVKHQGNWITSGISNSRNFFSATPSVAINPMLTPAMWADSINQAQLNAAITLCTTGGFECDTNGWTHAKSAPLTGSFPSYDTDGYYGNGTAFTNATIMAQRVGDILGYGEQLLGLAFDSTNWAYGTGGSSYLPLLPSMYADGVITALGSEPQLLDTAPIGFYNTAGNGCVKSGSLFNCAIYDFAQSEKGTTNNSAVNSYNLTRSTFGFIQTHTDMEYPWSDYVNAEQMGYAQKYDMNSTWFCGDVSTCFAYWSDTMSIIDNGTATFQWDPLTSAITLAANFGSASQVNPQMNDPIVWRFPVSFGGFHFQSATDNQGSGYIANTTSQWANYQISSAKGLTTITAKYSLSVSQSISVVVANFASPGYASLSGCGAQPSTIPMDGSPQLVRVTGGCSLSINAPDASNVSRYVFDESGTLSSTLHLLTGSLQPQTITAYYQVASNFEVSSAGKQTFGTGLQWNVKGTSGGLDTTLCTINSTDSGTGSCTAWADYNTPIMFPSVADQLVSGTRWASDGNLSFNALSPGMNFVVSYFKQDNMSYSFTVSGGGSNYEPPEITIVQFGEPSTIAITQAPTAQWVDSGSSWNASNSLVGSTANQRWFLLNSTGTVSQTGDITLDYQHQYFLTISSNLSSIFGGIVSPQSSWISVGSSILISAQNNSNYEWVGTGSGSYTGMQSAANITVNNPIVETGHFALVSGSQTGTTTKSNSPQGFPKSDFGFLEVLSIVIALIAAATVAIIRRPKQDNKFVLKSVD